MNDMRIRLACTVPGCERQRPEHQWICKPCLAHVERDIASVPALWRELDVTLTRQDVIGGSGPRPAETPLPFKETAAEARWVLANVIGTWARVLAEQAGLITPERPAQWLLLNVRSLAMHEAVAEAVDEIGDAVRNAYRVIDRPLELLLAGICATENCEAMLYAQPWDIKTTCRACGAVHDVVERREWMAAAAADYLVTATEALSWVWLLTDKAIPRGTWDSWRSRGQIQSHGQTPEGRPTYRFGDVRYLAEGWVARRAAA